MKRADIKALFEGMEGDFSSIIDSILEMNGKDINGIKADRDDLQKQLTEIKAIPNNTEELEKKLSELQNKYDTETKALQEQINERTYADAISAAISENNIKFSSKAAESYFKSQLENKRLEIADGKLKGFEDFYKTQLEADKSAFVTEEQPQPKPHFLGSAGGGNQSAMTAAQAAAARFNAKFAKTGGGTK